MSKVRPLPGFTIIELLVVITIVALLSSVIVVSLTSARIRARNVSVKNTVSQAGKAVETFKNQSDDRVLIVQRPRWMINGSLQQLGFCFDSIPKERCFYPHGILQDVDFGNGMVPGMSDTGFSNELFNGGAYGSLSSYPLKITAAPASNYYYIYMTRDCSWDTPPGGVHKFSKFRDYLLLAQLKTEDGTTSPGYFWLNNGVTGTALTEVQIPLVPDWVEGPRYEAADYIINGCSNSYP